MDFFSFFIKNIIDPIIFFILVVIMALSMILSSRNSPQDDNPLSHLRQLILGFIK